MSVNEIGTAGASVKACRRQYHFEMILGELMSLHLQHKARRGGDTRSYLSLDLGEQKMLIELLEAIIGKQKEEAS